MAQAGISVVEGMVYELLPIAEGFMKGYCISRFAEPFLAAAGMVGGVCPSGDMEPPLSRVRKKKIAALGGAAYFFVFLFFYATKLSMDYYLVYGMASLAMFLVTCWMDRRNYRQKAFLVATFFSLSLFAASMAEIIYDFLYDFALGTAYMRSHPALSPVLYILMCSCDLAFEFTFTSIGCWQVVRVYVSKEEEMGKKELVMLALPSLMGVIGYEIMRYYRVFYALRTGTMEKAYDSLAFLFCLASSVTVIEVTILYQGIKAKQEKSQQAKFLAAQAASIRRHIGQVEGLYHNIRSMKHDMANHILILERLYEKGEIREAEAYGKCLQEGLAKMSGGIKSGNPVTDVILQEFAREAQAKGISFCTEFYYPVGAGIDVFDVSVILNNALQNAVEHTREGAGKQISIVSYQRNNAYLVEICNSFTGSLKWNAESGLPATSKEKADGHGYGLANIRSVAGKYAGDIDISLKGGEFCLCIMLMGE